MLLVPLVTACDATTASAPPRIPADSPQAAVQAAAFTPLEEIGMFVFNDAALSLRRNQPCSSCHDRFWGFTSPNATNSANGAVMPGSTGAFGSRKTPTAAYAANAPVRFFDPTKGFVGGNFWDGRATGATLGNPAADQALLPFMSPLEQALPDLACVLFGIKQSFYAARFSLIFGLGLAAINFPANTTQLCGQAGATVPLSVVDRALAKAEYDNVARAILAFETSSVVNAFSSKQDAVLDGLATFTEQERRGQTLFVGKAGCATCHVSAGRKALFTNYTYENLGVPSNPKNPALVANPQFRDQGSVARSATRHSMAR